MSVYDEGHSPLVNDWISCDIYQTDHLTLAYENDNDEYNVPYLRIYILHDEERDNQLEVLAFLIQNQLIKWQEENTWNGGEELQNDSSPKEILEFAKRNFYVNDLSAALLGSHTENDNNPSFTVIHREFNRNNSLSYERITIPIDDLMYWYSKNKN